MGSGVVIRLKPTHWSTPAPCDLSFPVHVLGNEVLIGQSIVDSLDLPADGQGRRLLPNPAQPVMKVK